jgi:GNAT superfamily N-acetyltransferase
MPASRDAHGEPGPLIERLALPAREADVHDLAEVLVDAVASGAAVSFLSPLDAEAARAWWRSTLANRHPKAVFLVARESSPNGRIIGTAQLQPAWAPNQPHRAEVCKVIVHRDARGRGVGQRLMESLDDAAREAGFTLLTLDAKGGGAAERLYERLGWVRVGAIPRFALDPDARAFHATVIFYREIAAHAG